MKKIIIVFTFLLYCSCYLDAQQSFGTIKGYLNENGKDFNKIILVNLSEISSLDIVQQTNINPPGEFIFRDVPFGTYKLNVIQNDSILFSQKVVLNTPVPLKIFCDTLKEYRMEEVLISGSDIFDKTLGSSTTLFPSETINHLPVASDTKKIESVLLNIPGVIPDEDGRLHVRGEDAQLQYLIDGIPITGNMTRVYSSLLNANIIKTVSIQTGNYDAEYGVANAAIISVNTKSGFDGPFTARAYSSVSTFNSHDEGLELGGMLSNNIAAYSTINHSTSNRYLDPIASVEPNHSFGNNTSFFTKINALLNSETELHLIGSFNSTGFDIPNFYYGSNQNQQQKMSDYLIGIRVNIATGSNSILSGLLYRRYSKMNFTSGGLYSLNSQAEYAQAVIQNEKMFIGGKRVNENNGFQIEWSNNIITGNILHNIKAGLGGEIYPLREFFTFAVTNPDLSDPSFPGGDLRYLPYDITKGGKPFLVDQSKTGKRYSAFLQDQFRLNDDWIINAGLRFDKYSLVESESEFSPRIGASYRINKDLVIRASYNRIFMQAPNENYLVSSSNEARILTGNQQEQTPNIVRSERSHAFDLGVGYKLNSYIYIDLNGYSKFINNFLVKVELGNSGIIFPINIKNGLAAGGELRISLHKWNNLFGFVSVSTSTSLGLKPNDGSSPISAGLILGEEGQNYSHPFAGEDMFPTEHNQLMTIVLNTNYQHPKGFFGVLTARFDSGLPFDLTDQNGAGLDESASIAELKRRGYSDEIINLLSLSSEKPGSPDKSLKPRVIFDLGLGYNFNNLFNIPIKLNVNILNVFDTKFLYKFESSFGGTHFGYPRMVQVKGELEL